MDKLAKTLRDDAAAIRADVSTELDDRLRASLEALEPATAPAKRPRRSLSLWWASSLTGAAAAAVVIVLLNWGTTPGTGVTVPVDPGVVNGAVPGPAVLMPEVITEVAVMTEPLERELENLESDLKKAEAAVRRELGFDL